MHHEPHRESCDDWRIPLGVGLTLHLLCSFQGCHPERVVFVLRRRGECFEPLLRDVPCIEGGVQACRPDRLHPLYTGTTAATVLGAALVAGVRAVDVDGQIDCTLSDPVLVTV